MRANCSDRANAPGGASGRASGRASVRASVHAWARATARHAAPARGFTLVELIGVLILTGVLAMVALPRMDGATSLRGAAWRDQVLAALRQAHQLAQGHRRLVCASVAAGAVTLSIADSNPATACNQALAGPDGHPSFAHAGSAMATVQSPAGTLYFQASGRITSDGAGLSAVNASIAIAGETAIDVVGETGHVE